MALQDTLESLNCGSVNTPLVLNIGEDTVNDVNLVIAYLGFSSLQCQNEGIPFLCLYLFGGACASTSMGPAIQPTRSQCKRIMQTLCSSEWALAESFDLVPSCEIFPEEQVSCQAQGGSGFGSSAENGTGSGLEPKDALLSPLGKFIPLCQSY